MFGKRQTTTAAPTVAPLAHDACIARRRAIQAAQTRELDALRPAVQAAETECATRQAELQAARAAHWHATERYGEVARRFDRDLANSEAELRAFRIPAIESFVGELQAEIDRLHRLGHSSQAKGFVVDGRGQRRAIVHTNYEGHRALLDQLRAAQRAADALQYSATEAELPGEFQKLRDAIDYSLLEKFDGPAVPNGDPVFAA